MFKHRTSIEFPPDLWKELSAKVPERKKGTFITEAVKEKLSREATKLVILCGGEGTRMRPLTFSIPKPMLPIGYKPILEHTLQSYSNQGFHNVVLSIGYLAEHIVKYFGNGSSMGINIQYVSEKHPLGTGGALKNAENLVNSTFVCTYGDVLFGNINLKEIIQFHREKRALGTIVLWKAKDARRFGLVEIDGNGRILDFTEKPKYMTSGLINAGLCILEPEIFKFIPKNKTVSLENDVFTELVKKENLYGFVYNGYWADIGVPEDYERVAQHFLSKKIS
ncbi:MAG: nucleotidyltransferase family protein [Candidatus Aenigmarchaeota archaeon]|nr:nucleotidyltransferase family protein [Candidatus Aenigmarchaeota archaeon]